MWMRVPPVLLKHTAGSLGSALQGSFPPPWSLEELSLYLEKSIGKGRVN